MRWRARTTLDLVAGYYRKARSGPPLARSVLTAAYRQRLSGVFAGDWLAFLSCGATTSRSGLEFALIPSTMPEQSGILGHSAWSFTTIRFTDILLVRPLTFS